MKIPVCPLTVTHVIITIIKKERRFHFVITTAYGFIGLSSPSFWCTPTRGPSEPQVQMRRRRR
jgi:hypothetical protein